MNGEKNYHYQYRAPNGKRSTVVLLEARPKESKNLFSQSELSFFHNSTTSQDTSEDRRSESHCNTTWEAGVMYIERKAYDQLPPDAIVLDETEALKYLETTVFSWKPAKDVWAFRYGSALMSGYSLFTTSYIASYFRNRVRLPPGGNISYHMVTAGTCGLISLMYYVVFIQPAVLLQKECTKCVYLKAVGGNLGIFAVYGFCGSAFVSALAADTLNSYPIPGFQSFNQVKETALTYVRFSKRLAPTLAVFTVFNVVLTYALVRTQYKQFASMNRVLYERDEKIRDAYTETFAKERITNRNSITQ